MVTRRIFLFLLYWKMKYGMKIVSLPHQKTNKREDQP